MRTCLKDARGGPFSSTRPMKRLLSTGAVFAGFLMLAACSSTERPDATNDFVPADDEPMLLPAEAPAPKRICSPGAERECVVYYREEGRVNCFPAQQFCRADGFGWLECGAPAQDPLPESPAPPVSDEGDASADAAVVR